MLLLRPHAHTREFAAGRGFRPRAIERSRPCLGEGYAGRAALERQTISASDLSTAADFTRAGLRVGEGFVTYRVTPLAAKGQIRGCWKFSTARP